ncbi:hypothetical protein LSH36_59g08061, partial [Paralvinella palmiformis]
VDRGHVTLQNFKFKQNNTSDNYRYYINLFLKVFPCGKSSTGDHRCDQAS